MTSVLSSATNHLIRIIQIQSEGGQKKSSMASTDEKLDQMNQILDHIRSNLRNVRNTWGGSSPQYRSAVAIMERALIENATRLKMQDSELEELMGRLDLNRDPAQG